LKLGDFGICGFLDSRLTIPGFLGRVQNIYGSAQFCPPEQLEYSKNFSYTKPTMDIFSFGVTMYYVLSGGVLPFKLNNNSNTELMRIKNLKINESYIPLKQLNPYLDSKWNDLVNKCLKYKVEKRFQSVEEIFNFLNMDANSTIFDGFWEKPNGDMLQIIRGEELGKCFDLTKYLTEKKYVLIGRNSSITNDISISETYTKYISSKHATLECIENKWFLRDGQYVSDNGHSQWSYSLNGTVVNYTYKLGGQCKMTEVFDGDIIEKGDTVFKLHLLSK